ncbi:MAG: Nif3-like dinuclear metal center hexameric protein [Bacteroidales bacterium]|nr:Nif3-like dinuclear metal center hexameric protein [Candidatus Colicola faecequi]
MLLKDIINIIESVAPLSNQEDWDNSGLQIGDKEASVSSVLLCTDVTDSIVDEAIRKGCQLIVSHHPLLFHPLHTIQSNTLQGRAVIRCIREGIGIYSSHTPMDCYLHGVSGRMAELLGVKDYRILHPTKSEDVGFGVIGELEEAIPFEQLLAKVKEVFEVPAVRYMLPTQGMEQKVKRIGMCGGAAAEFAEDAIEQGAEVYISADWKHHQFLEYAGKIGVMDIGHFESEQHTKDVMAALLIEATDEVEVILAESDKSPVLAY